MRWVLQNTISTGLVVFILGLSFPLWTYARSCKDFLSLSLETHKGSFLSHTTLRPLNLLSNPLENFIINDSSLDVPLARFKILDSHTPARNTITLEPQVQKNTKKKSSAANSERRVFDLKYVIFDSEYSIMLVSTKNRNIWSTELGRELLKAKELIAQNPDIRILLTDTGVSLWSKKQLESWLSDYLTYSLTPQSMKEFIYESAHDLRYNPTVSTQMAMRAVKELEAYKNFELSKQDVGAADTGIKTDGLTFIYRSVFREALLQQRLEFLKHIGKETSFTQLTEKDKALALQTLAFFPEFLYQPNFAHQLGLKSEYMLSDGSLVFSAPPRATKSFEGFDVTLKAMRSVDDFKSENLSLALVITKRNSIEGVSVYDLLKLQEAIEGQWQALDSILKPSHRLQKRDLRFNLETHEQTGETQLVILASPLLVQHGSAPYLLYGLLHQL